MFVSLAGGKDEYMPRFMEAFDALYAPIAPVECRAEKIGIQRYDLDGRAWIHLLNYQYDEAADRITPVPELRLTAQNLPGTDPEILVPEGSPVPEYTIRRNEGLTEITLYGAGLYTVLAFGA